MGNEQVATPTGDARADWEARIGLRRHGGSGREALPPPTGLRAVGGRGQVTLDWEPVAGAVGYLVHRADRPDGPYLPLDHQGGDVLAVPHPPYADTTGEPGRTYHYAVATLADVDVCGQPGAGVAVASTPDGPAAVRVTVDAAGTDGPVHRPWRRMIGAERLSHLLCADTTGGRPIGAEFTEALSIMHRDLGVETVRAHAILHDDVGVYREVDGRPVYDFSRVDEIYDTLLGLGLRPVVELSFMPADLAREPDRTVFAFDAIISPPRDWDRWADLVRALVTHLVDRYGLAEVRRWEFEVWNEANLEVFWTGTREEYLRLYEVSARAVRDVDAALRVGGPGSAAAAWNGALLDHVVRTGAPIDFLSTHTYGSPPLDLRPLCEAAGRPDLELLWTEWGITPTHFNPVTDGVFAAAFLLRGMRSAAGRIEALAYWVASDHFEELGRPPRLFHGGFGLLTVGNLRKPRYWALAALARLGDDQLPVTVDGDGAGSLVEMWAARHADGRVHVLVWNGTLDQSKAGGAPALERDVRVDVAGLADRPYRLTHWRVDATHSNIEEVWARHGGGDWPDDAQWSQLRAADTLDRYEPDTEAHPADGVLGWAFPLPMPGFSLLELVPLD
ncbi:GH39 family glycosyl hydrolase [Micromonospora echinospora]|uniref:GH39 family glycosyl hydrolase n=1 Tax=Micromonospora echinospora TaxID=1877 RepID=UPI003A899DDF